MNNPNNSTIIFRGKPLKLKFKTFNEIKISLNVEG